MIFSEVLARGANEEHGLHSATIFFSFSRWAAGLNCSTEDHKLFAAVRKASLLASTGAVCKK